MTIPLPPLPNRAPRFTDSDPETLETAQLLLMAYIDAAHRAAYRISSIDRKRPYEPLMYAALHLNEAFRALGREPTRGEAIRRQLLARQSRSRSRELPFLRNLVAATSCAAQCWYQGIPALPLVWEVAGRCGLSPSELLNMALLSWENHLQPADRRCSEEEQHEAFLSCLQEPEA